LKQIPYKDLMPIEMELPPRQPDNGYRRPKKSSQHWVRQSY
jgi:polyphosphate kinase